MKGGFELRFDGLQRRLLKKEGGGPQEQEGDHRPI